MIVVIPLFYFNVFTGRRGSGHSDIGWSTYDQLYGWPCVYGYRVISEPWFSSVGFREIGPLEQFNGRAVAVNAATAVAMLVGSVYVVECICRIIRDRQFSLGNVLMLFAVTGCLCCFIKYDRAGGIPYSVYIEIGDDLAFDLHRSAPTIADSPIWIFVPMLFGIAASIYATFAAVARIVIVLWRRLRRAMHEL